MKNTSWFLPHPQFSLNYHKLLWKMVQVLRPSGLRCTACWRVSPTARTPLHLSALCPLLETSLFHVYTTTLPAPHPPEQLGRDALHNFLDALGEAHRCDFTYCLILKIVRLTLIQARLRLKQTKSILFMEFKQSSQRLLKTQDRKERKLHAAKMLHYGISKGFSSHIPVRSKLTWHTLPGCRCVEHPLASGSNHRRCAQTEGRGRPHSFPSLWFMPGWEGGVQGHPSISGLPALTNVVFPSLVTLWKCWCHWAWPAFTISHPGN